MTSNNEIYRIAKRLSLEKKDVDSIISRSASITMVESKSNADLYKAGTKYGTVGYRDVYKDGTLYGTVSIKDF